MKALGLATLGALGVGAVGAAPPSEAPSPAAIREVVEDANDEAFQIGKLLRCPVCQGMSVAESPSQMAQDMMKKVRELHATGMGREDILNYFEERYGEFARLRPQAKGINWLVWLGPGLMALAGLLLIRQVVRRSRGASEATEPAQVASASSDDGNAEEDDAYLRMIREEVQQ